MKRSHLLLLFVTLFLAALPAAQAPESVAGKWHFVLDTEGGPREADAEFAVADGKVTGKWAGTEVAGTYTEGKLDLAFKFTSPEAGDGTLKISGKLEAENLKGTWAFEQYTGTFVAKRP
jgi:hypothetical protein